MKRWLLAWRMIENSDNENYKLAEPQFDSLIKPIEAPENLDKRPMEMGMMPVELE